MSKLRLLSLVAAAAASIHAASPMGAPMESSAPTKGLTYEITSIGGSYSTPSIGLEVKQPNYEAGIRGGYVFRESYTLLDTTVNGGQLTITSDSNNMVFLGGFMGARSAVAPSVVFSGGVDANVGLFDKYNIGFSSLDHAPFNIGFYSKMTHEISKSISSYAKLLAVTYMNTGKDARPNSVSNGVSLGMTYYFA